MEAESVGRFLNETKTVSIPPDMYLVHAGTGLASPSDMGASKVPGCRSHLCQLPYNGRMNLE